MKRQWLSNMVKCGFIIWHLLERTFQDEIRQRKWMRLEKEELLAIKNHAFLLLHAWSNNLKSVLRTVGRFSWDSNPQSVVCKSTLRLTMFDHTTASKPCCWSRIIIERERLRRTEWTMYTKSLAISYENIRTTQVCSTNKAELQTVQEFRFSRCNKDAEDDEFFKVEMGTYNLD